ncbi:sugar ABC transporter ATP-binding protein [Nocardioides humi]
MTFPGTRALQDVSVHVAPGEIHALVGHNGSGKSTLIKCMSGYYQPDPGATCSADGRSMTLGDGSEARSAGLAFVHQNLGLVHQMSVTDNLALEWGDILRPVRRIDRRAESRRAELAMNEVGYPTSGDRCVADLKPSERVGVALARAMWRPGKVRYLVLDEPTASMPAAEVEQLLGSMCSLRDRGVGILFVSHHLHEVVEIADAVTVLKDGQVVQVFRRGEFDHGSLVRLVGGEEAALANGRVRPDSDDAPEPAKPESLAVLTVDGLSAPGVRGFSTVLSRGEIVGIAGVTGSGREVVLQAIFGAVKRTGTVSVGDGAMIPDSRPDISIREGMQLVPADRAVHAVFPNLSFRENLYVNRLAGGARYRVRHSRERDEATQWGRRLQVRPNRSESMLSNFSGGNQQKIVLGRALEADPQVLLLAEPTQGVDVGSAAEIHRLIIEVARGGAGVLVASSDEEELAAICDRVLVMREGLVTRELSGSEATSGALVGAVLGPNANQQATKRGLTDGANSDD